MDVRTLMATLAVLGTGAPLAGCNSKPDPAPAAKSEAKPAAKEVPAAKPAKATPTKAAAEPGTPAAQAGADAHDEAGEMACAPGKCGAEMMKKKPEAEAPGDKS